MLILPGFIVSVVTFPGVIIHEAAHVLACKLRGVVVKGVCYFRFGNPAGYVVHESIHDFNTSFLVCVGPFILNSLLCILLAFPAFVVVEGLNVKDEFSYLMIWLGVSIGMHAFPSKQDANELWGAANIAAKRLNPLALVSYPLVILIHAVNILRVIWADLFYGIFLGLVLPQILLERLM